MSDAREKNVLLPTSVPTTAGIGLRAPHYRDILASKPHIGWLEIHSENYFGDGGQPLFFLEQLRAEYPLSAHGVGLSLGSADGVDTLHLAKLKRLIERFQPGLVSEHLCWGRIDGQHLNDLLPLPYTEEALKTVCTHITYTQDFLNRRILIENVSSYIQFHHSTMPEWEFLTEVTKRTGCGILLDINNVYVSAVNHRFDALQYLHAIPAETIEEIHLAGFEQGPGCLIDTHGTRVCDAVWELYQSTIDRIGARPTLIEWDTHLPTLNILLEEAAQAAAILQTAHAIAA